MAPVLRPSDGAPEAPVFTPEPGAPVAPVLCPVSGAPYTNGSGSVSRIGGPVPGAVGFKPKKNRAMPPASNEAMSPPMKPMMPTTDTAMFSPGTANVGRVAPNKEAIFVEMATAL